MAMALQPSPTTPSHRPPNTHHPTPPPAWDLHLARDHAEGLLVVLPGDELRAAAGEAFLHPLEAAVVAAYDRTRVHAQLAIGRDLVGARFHVRLQAFQRPVALPFDAMPADSLARG